MIEIKPVLRNQVRDLLDLIKKLALYEKKLEAVTGTEALLETYLFDQKVAQAVFIYKENQIIGFALYFYNFSTFLTKPGLYLEDLFVLEPYRHQGIGKKVFEFLIDKAITEDLGRIEWSCLTWNEPAINFYHKLGAVIKDEWYTFQLTKENVANPLKDELLDLTKDT